MNRDFDYGIRQVQRNQLTSISPEIIRKSQLINPLEFA